MHKLVEIKNVKKSYGKKMVLDEINLSIEQGEFVLISGKSGCGKSTLLNIIGLLDEFDKGEYIFNGVNVFKGFGVRERIRAYDIGFVFQSYCLLDNLSVKDNVLMPLFYNNTRINKECMNTMERYFEVFGLSKLRNTKVKYLSGGEKQRTAIVRAIVKNPALVVADEPTGNLDPINSKIIYKELGKLTELGKSVLVVTHNKDVFKNVCSKYKIEDGKIIDD